MAEYVKTKISKEFPEIIVGISVRDKNNHVCILMPDNSQQDIPNNQLQKATYEEWNAFKKEMGYDKSPNEWGREWIISSYDFKDNGDWVSKQLRGKDWIEHGIKILKILKLNKVGTLKKFPVNVKFFKLKYKNKKPCVVRRSMGNILRAAIKKWAINNKKTIEETHKIIEEKL